MSSSFYGQETASEAPSAVDRPLRKYEFWDIEDKSRKVIEANFIRFEPHHVSFWLERTDPDSQATLVLAEVHYNVTELKELAA